MWWGEVEDIGRRPFLVMTRTAAVPVLHGVLAAPITRTIRGILDRAEAGTRSALRMPTERVVGFDTLRLAAKAYLVERQRRLDAARLVEACAALRVAVDAHSPSSPTAAAAVCALTTHRSDDPSPPGGHIGSEPPVDCGDRIGPVGAVGAGVQARAEVFGRGGWRSASSVECVAKRASHAGAGSFGRAADGTRSAPETDGAAQLG